jgi:hypothetical protein
MASLVRINPSREVSHTWNTTCQSWPKTQWTSCLLLPRPLSCSPSCSSSQWLSCLEPWSPSLLRLTCPCPSSAWHSALLPLSCFFPWCFLEFDFYYLALCHIWLSLCLSYATGRFAEPTEHQELCPLKQGAALWVSLEPYP